MGGLRTSGTYDLCMWTSSILVIIFMQEGRSGAPCATCADMAVLVCVPIIELRQTHQNAFAHGPREHTEPVKTTQGARAVEFRLKESADN